MVNFKISTKSHSLKWKNTSRQIPNKNLKQYMIKLKQLRLS